MATKTDKLEIRVSPAQRSRYEHAAAKAGVDLSSWARSRLDAAAAEIDDRDGDPKLTDDQIDALVEGRMAPSTVNAIRDHVRKLRRARWI
jgi:uncharacterized protein (DUF1778 family)